MGSITVRNFIGTTIWLDSVQVANGATANNVSTPIATVTVEGIGKPFKKTQGKFFDGGVYDAAKPGGENIFLTFSCPTCTQAPNNDRVVMYDDD